ncbi:MAG: polymer-forming cytoskeletal protein [bacterium]
MSVESSNETVAILGKSYPAVAPFKAQAGVPVKTQVEPPSPPLPVAKYQAPPPPPPPPVFKPQIAPPLPAIKSQASAPPKSVPPVQPPTPPPPAMPKKDFSPEQMAIPTPAPPPKLVAPAPTPPMATPPPPKQTPPITVPRIALMKPTALIPPTAAIAKAPVPVALNAAPSHVTANPDPYPYLQKPQQNIASQPKPIAPPVRLAMPVAPQPIAALEAAPLSAQQQLAEILAKGRLAFKKEQSTPPFQSAALSSPVVIPEAIERKLMQKFNPEQPAQAPALYTPTTRELPHMKEEKNNMVLVPAGTEIEGMLKTTLPVTIYGKVFGKIQSTSKVVIEKDGDVQADVECTELDIFGSADGEIQATQEIRLHKSGRLVGIVKTPNLKTESGSFFQGMVQMDQAA